jgi:hypothetical protein
MQARIAAPQLLHGFVRDADSFLPDLRRVLYSAFQRPHFCNRRRNRVRTNRTPAYSAAADLILSHSVRLGAKHARAACESTQPRIHEISTGENHEISALDYSNADADERDDDLVQ